MSWHPLNKTGAAPPPPSLSNPPGRLIEGSGASPGKSLEARAARDRMARMGAAARFPGRADQGEDRYRRPHLLDPQLRHAQVHRSRRASCRVSRPPAPGSRHARNRLRRTGEGRTLGQELERRIRIQDRGGDDGSARLHRLADRIDPGRPRRHGLSHAAGPRSDPAALPRRSGALLSPVSPGNRFFAPDRHKDQQVDVPRTWLRPAGKRLVGKGSKALETPAE